ncbi:PREDICTED: mast cell carboxypeptidase A-like [Papilio xuthus]|uniref:Mast cell carboxypeptidase A-like n=1 Tax=Papilio xuthus TaxID=66420 RepID=A0AAJ7E4R4_PAPXU|nr:PREDICTED: mast cell carboxypeptidase A-like [Papilio xuthus]
MKRRFFCNVLLFLSISLFSAVSVESLKNTKSILRKNVRRQGEDEQPTTEENEKFQDEEEVELPSTFDPYNIQAQLKKVATKFPDVNITIEVIGRTVEYNDIVLLKVSELQNPSRRGKYEDTSYEKKIIFIVHGLSVKGIDSIPCLSEVSYFQTLLHYYIEFLDKFDIYLIPMANPDGIAYPRAFWNKNVSPQKACPGVALDRNFDVAWNFTKLISSCSQHYPGFMPFSERETQAIRRIFHYHHHKIIAYINVHGNGFDEKTFKGEAVLYPKGYTEFQEDDDQYIDLKGEVDEAIRNASFRLMAVTVDTLYSWYGIICGASVDYASTVFGVPFSLEFVMQPYSAVFNYNAYQNEVAYDSLNAIWGRIIRAVFQYIWDSSRYIEKRRLSKLIRHPRKFQFRKHNRV